MRSLPVWSALLLALACRSVPGSAPRTIVHDIHSFAEPNTPERCETPRPM